MFFSENEEEIYYYSGLKALCVNGFRGLICSKLKSTFWLAAGLLPYVPGLLM